MTSIGSRIETKSTGAIALISLVWLGMIVVAQPWGEFPLNDDWVYALAVKSVLATGYYQFPSPSSANVGPQVYWGALFCLPFGFSFTALRVSTMVLGWAGVVYLFRLLRLLGGNERAALVGALALAVNPLYFGLSMSFMTDVPFTALCIAAIHYLLRAQSDDSARDAVLGLALCFAAIMVRQLGIALLVGFAAAQLYRFGPSVRRLLGLAVLLAAGVLLHIGYQYWMVHSGRTPVISIHSNLSLMAAATSSLWAVRLTAGDILSHAGFFVLPLAALLCSWPLPAQRRTPLRSLAAGAAALFVLLCALAWWKQRWLPSAVSSSVLIPSGFGPLTLRDTLLLDLNLPSLPAALQAGWVLLTVLSLLSACVWAFRVAASAWPAWQMRDDRPTRQRYASLPFLAAAALSYVAVMLYASVRFPIFDRYYLFLAPLLLAAAFAGEPGWRWATGGVRLGAAGLLLAVLAAMSVTAVHDYMAWNRARWAALDGLTKQGIDARRIDGGYEFNGLMLYDPHYLQSPAKSWWWVDGDEYVIGSGPMTGYVVIERYDFQRWFTQRPGLVVVLRRAAP